jgi:hypothetical protein
MTRPEPAAFFSYVHADNEYENGQILELCDRIEGAIRMHTGWSLSIFRDRHDIAWGERWRERVDGAIDASTILIPVVTPSFLISPECRREVERFADRERALGRNDLILPIYYVTTPAIDDPERRATDELAALIATHQYVDWRELRFVPVSGAEVRMRVAELGARIGAAADAVRSAAPTPNDAPSPAQPDAASSSGSSDSATVSAGSPGPVSKNEPPTAVVDPFQGRGDYTSVGEAVAAAKPGDRILVHPGLYEEAFEIDKPLEILGQGPVEDIVVRSTDASAIVFKSSFGRISNMSIRVVGTNGLHAGVDIVQGRLELEDCDITSSAWVCVAVRNGADPRLRRNRIHDGAQSGVFVYDQGLGTFEDNDIYAHAYAAVDVQSGGNPTVRRNRIHDGKQNGVLVGTDGLGTFEDNDIFGTALPGVATMRGGNPTVRRNRIHDGGQGGVYVYEHGLGKFEENDIFRNTLAGVSTSEGGNPAARRNQIHDGLQSGVFVYEEGLGLFEDNDIFGNAGSGIVAQEGGDPSVRRNRVNRNGHVAIRVRDGGRGSYEGNDVSDNPGGAYDVEPDCEDNVELIDNIES